MKPREPVPEWARSEIKKAVRMIHTGDHYHEGMTMLCRLAGLKVVDVQLEPFKLSDLKKPQKFGVSKKAPNGPITPE